MKKAKIIISGLLFVFAIILLAFFPESMMDSVGKVPLGTFIAWFAVLFYAMFWYYFFPERMDSKFFRILKRLKNTHFILAILWGFFSALLAGNWQFSFQNRQIQFKFWIIFTGFLVVTPLLVLVIFGIRRLICIDK
ncbi:MAG TPA: hypothetical protein PK335_05695 [Draconibacterium sp.]|nr:hypothetical protein [Draconibacterium sp.]